MCYNWYDGEFNEQVTKKYIKNFFDIKRKCIDSIFLLDFTVKILG